MRVACVVPATDDPETLERCLEAIRRSESPPDEILCITEPSGSGPAAARNAGVSRTDAEVVAFVDSDVVVHADAFARVRAAFESDPELAALFGAYDDEPEDPGTVSGFRNLLHHQVHVDGAGESETFWAGLGAVRRSALEAAGGFDAERFPLPSVEDIDLGMRIAADGGRIRLDPAIRGTHLRRWTLGGMARTDFSRRGLPWAELVLERRRGGGALNLGPRHRASTAAALVLLGGLLTRRPRMAALAAAAVVALNARLFGAVLRRRGPAQAAAALPLLVLHQLTGAAAALAALVRHASRRLP